MFPRKTKVMPAAGTPAPEFELDGLSGRASLARRS